MQARLVHFLALPAYKPLPHTFERIAVCELYFSTKMQISKSSNKNKISTTILNHGEPLVRQCIKLS